MKNIDGYDELNESSFTKREALRCCSEPKNQRRKTPSKNTKETLLRFNSINVDKGVKTTLYSRDKTLRI